MDAHANPVGHAPLRIRERLYRWLYDAGDGSARGEKIEMWLSLLIIANFAAMILTTIPAFDPYERQLHYFEMLSMVIFTTEYAARLFIAPADPAFSASRFPRLAYARTFFALVDLLVILPFLLSAFVALDLRLLRILRMLRILKLMRVLLPAFHEFAQLNKGRTFRQKVHAFAFPSAYGGKLHGYYELFIVGWVLLSVLAVILESVDSIFYNLAVEFVALDAIAVLVFSIEYMMRFYSCVEEPKFQKWLSGRVNYARGPAPLIDLLAILPFFLEIFLHHLIDLRFLRSFRLMRLFKLARYSGSTSTLFSIVRRELPVIAASAFCMMLLVILAASFGYLFEHDAQPDKFENIPTAIYWAVITLASVGYGDISPITPMGRLMTTVMALMGIGLFAIPASILSSAFMHEMQSQRQAVENQLSGMLADGVLSDEEHAEVQRFARSLNIPPDQLEVLIDKAKRENDERQANDMFLPVEFLVAHTEIAVAQFHMLFEQLRRLAELPNAADMQARMESANTARKSEWDTWRLLRDASEKKD